MPIQSGTHLGPYEIVATIGAGGNECMKLAPESHREIVAVREDVQKDSAAVKLARLNYVSDVSAFAHWYKTRTGQGKSMSHSKGPCDSVNSCQR